MRILDVGCSELPFLSRLPHRRADHYVRTFGTAPRRVLPTLIWVAGPSPRTPRGTGAALPPEQLD